MFGTSPIYMRPALNTKRLSGDQLIEVRDHEYCLKEELAMFRNPPEKQGFRENNPPPFGHRPPCRWTGPYHWATDSYRDPSEAAQKEECLAHLKLVPLSGAQPR